MGRIGEAMRDFWEGIGGFLSLGGRDAANKFSIMSRGIRVRSIDKKIAAQRIELGKKAWEKKIPFSDSLPVADRIRNLESSAEGKHEAADEVRARIEELQGRRQEHLTHYQNKISEQLELKRPVDSEMTSMLAETKRLQRELSTTEREIKTLSGKIELQKNRLKEIEGQEGDQSAEYLRSEIQRELEFNDRTCSLKQEKVSFLKSRLDEHSRRAEKIKKVVDQYEEQIAELRKSQREGAAKIESSLRQLQSSLGQIEGDMRRINTEMHPLYGELGAELEKRPFSGSGLDSIYSEISRLGREKDDHLREIAKRRADSSSISIGIKLGFYGLIVALLTLFIFLLVIIF